MAEECKHPHVSFEDGFLYVRCIDCDRHWVAVTQKGGPIDYTQMSVAAPFDKTRHSKWMLPRDQKEEKKPEISWKPAGKAKRTVK